MAKPKVPPPHGRRPPRPGGRLAGMKKKKHPSIKNQIRSLQRRLQKQGGGGECYSGTQVCMCVRWDVDGMCGMQASAEGPENTDKRSCAATHHSLDHESRKESGSSLLRSSSSLPALPSRPPTRIKTRTTAASPPPSSSSSPCRPGLPRGNNRTSSGRTPSGIGKSVSLRPASSSVATKLP